VEIACVGPLLRLNPFTMGRGNPTRL
jgi:hypothetical protein